MASSKALTAEDLAPLLGHEAPGTHPAYATRTRLRKKVAAKKAAARAAQSEACPLALPEDPKFLDTVQEAQRLFLTDQKQGTALYRLVARQGYVPALVLLANAAQGAKDESLAIETMFEMLLHQDAQAQLPSSVLSGYAAHLALTLRNDKHREKARARKDDLATLAKVWPAFNQIGIAQDAQDAFSAIRAAGVALSSRSPELAAARGPAGADDEAFKAKLADACNGVDTKRSEFVELKERCAQDNARLSELLRQSGGDNKPSQHGNDKLSELLRRSADDSKASQHGNEVKQLREENARLAALLKQNGLLDEGGCAEAHASGGTSREVCSSLGSQARGAGALEERGASAHHDETVELECMD